MITAREHLGVAAYKEFIFATGGSSIDGSLATVEKYNTLTNQWSSGSSMATKRYQFACVTCGDYIYSIGGTGRIDSNSAEQYDIQTDRWIPIAPMKQPRACHAATSIGESIFVVGGRNESILWKSVEMYDTRSNKWMEIAPMNTGRSSLAAAICGNSIFAIGGQDNSCGVLKTVEKLPLF